MEDSTDSALEAMMLSGEKVSAKRSGKASKADAKVGAGSERGVEVVVMTGAEIVVFWTTTGAGGTGVTAARATATEDTATGSTGATLAATTGVTLATGAGAGPGACAMKFAPGAVEAARAFLFLLLRGMMKIYLWLLVSVLVVVV